MRETFPLFPKASFLFLFGILFVCLLCIFGWESSLCFLWLFFSLLSTRSALLPVPQVFLPEPFLNAKANKRKNVSFHGWQDNKAQRVGSRFVASSRLLKRALGTGELVHACRCMELRKSSPFPTLFVPFVYQMLPHMGCPTVHFCKVRTQLCPRNQ